MIICETCGKDVLECPCDIEFHQPLLRSIQGNRCPNCDEKVYCTGFHICAYGDDVRHDITMCWKCYAQVQFRNHVRLLIPDQGFKTRCECEIPDVR